MVDKDDVVGGGWARGAEEALWRGRERLEEVGAGAGVGRRVGEGGAAETAVTAGSSGSEERASKWRWSSERRGRWERVARSEKMGRRWSGDRLRMRGMAVRVAEVKVRGESWEGARRPRPPRRRGRDMMLDVGDVARAGESVRRVRVAMIGWVRCDEAGRTRDGGRSRKRKWGRRVMERWRRVHWVWRARSVKMGSWRAVVMLSKASWSWWVIHVGVPMGTCHKVRPVSQGLWAMLDDSCWRSGSARAWRKAAEVTDGGVAGDQVEALWRERPMVAERRWRRAVAAATSSGGPTMWVSSQ